MCSKNITHENIEKIGALFPHCITEATDEHGKIRTLIDFESLRQELSEDVVSDIQERYQFSWPDKLKHRNLANKPINKTLRPYREESVNFDKTENLYIEGDNLDVLKLLRETYLGKIKMIYIDPPYNTGNDFVYKDNFTINASEYRNINGTYDDEDNRLFKNTDANGRFHTDWLNMMYPRLRLARDLLSEDGVIFISIDDNELKNLRNISDEIFGEGNFVFQIAWRRTDNQPNVGNIARVKEYITCYSKNIKNFEFGRLPLSDKAKKEYRYKDDKGYFRRSILLHKTRGRHKYEVVTKNGNTLNGPWMIDEKRFKMLDEEGGIYWTDGGDEQPYGKIYLVDNMGQIPNDFWGIEYGTNQRASLEVERLFGNRFFDFPKPVSLIKTLITIGAPAKNSIILDFFSGSATTAQAIMELNSEDGGERKYILIQIPEKTDINSNAYKAGFMNICEIGKERIRLAGEQVRGGGINKSLLTTMIQKVRTSVSES